MGIKILCVKFCEPKYQKSDDLYFRKSELVDTRFLHQERERLTLFTRYGRKIMAAGAEYVIGFVVYQLGVLV